MTERRLTKFQKITTRVIKWICLISIIISNDRISSNLAHIHFNIFQRYYMGQKFQRYNCIFHNNGVPENTFTATSLRQLGEVIISFGTADNFFTFNRLSTLQPRKMRSSYFLEVLYDIYRLTCFRESTVHPTRFQQVVQQINQRLDYQRKTTSLLIVIRSMSPFRCQMIWDLTQLLDPFPTLILRRRKILNRSHLKMMWTKPTYVIPMHLLIVLVKIRKLTLVSWWRLVFFTIQSGRIGS